MRFRLLSASAAALVTALLVVVPGAEGKAQAAKVRQCGVIPNKGGVGGPGIVPGEKFFYRVSILGGTVRCPKARSVISQYSMGGQGPAGWTCTNANPTICTNGAKRVKGKFYGVPPKNKKKKKKH